MVSQAGLPFRTEDEILPQLDRLVRDYELSQRVIVAPSIEAVARTYLEVARLVLSD